MVIIRGPWPEHPERPQDPIEAAAEAESPPARLFRYSDDPRHVLRFTHGPPEGIDVRLEEFIEVAGISRPEARDSAEAFLKGDELRLELARDPDNPFDPNAIKVIGVWLDPISRVSRRAQIGWVPAAIAKRIAGRPAGGPIAATLRMGFLPHEGNSPGVRFDIWQPKGRRGK